MKATFGAGCFWGVENYFMKLKGVKSTKVGYMGGNVKNPTYEKVCTDKTGHIEVVQMDYDPDIISYGELLNHFWKMHDPTQKNRQEPDIGTQYKSIIFYHNKEQKELAEKSKRRLDASDRYKDKIQTDIRAVENFYLAEDYHQNYLEKNRRKGCRIQ